MARSYPFKVPFGATLSMLELIKVGITSIAIPVAGFNQGQNGMSNKADL